MPETPTLQTSGNAPYLLTAPSTRRIMWSVLLALLPGILMLCYYEGSRWLGNLGVALIAALCSEAFCLLLRRRPLHPLHDGSALITGALLALSLPVSAPAWLIFLATAFAILFAKQLYGGLGMNPFNPAMVGYLFALISFPALMGAPPDSALPLTSLWQPVDATTAATLLDANRNLRIDDAPIRALWHSPAFTATIAVNLAWLLGGGWLLYKRYADWRIVVAVLTSLLLTASLFWLIDPARYLDPFSQLLAGASLFGALFIATDPVSAATTARGRWLYGILIGILVILIRNLGNYPDGFAFAVLLANAAVPLIDPLTQPRYR